MELLPLVCLCLLSCSGDAVRVVVEDSSDAVLPCLISIEDLTGNAFDWRKDESRKEVFFYDSGNHYNNGRPGQDKQFIGRVSFFQDQLQNGNASIKITRTKMADSGTYSCIFPRLQSQKVIVELVVVQVLRDRTGENIPGAAPEPCIRTLAQTKDSSLLQCEAHGDPLPTLKWEDSDNNTLNAEKPQNSERRGRSYITVKITVTKTDTYHCVATQETLSHQIAAVTSVYIQGAASKPSVKTIKTDDGVVLQCEVLGVAPKPKVEWRDGSGDILPIKDLKETERGGLYDIVLQTAVTKTDNFRCVVTQEGISHQTEAEIYAVNGWSGWWVAGFIVVSLFLVGGVVFHFKDRIRQIYVECVKKNNVKEPDPEAESLKQHDSKSEKKSDGEKTDPAAKPLNPPEKNPGSTPNAANGQPDTEENTAV